MPHATGMIISRIANLHFGTSQGVPFYCGIIDKMSIALYIFGGIVFFFGIFALTGAPYVPSHKKELELLFKDRKSVV